MEGNKMTEEDAIELMVEIVERYNYLKKGVECLVVREDDWAYGVFTPLGPVCLN